MKSKLIVVTGGARSGKSLFAEEYLASCSGPQGLCRDGPDIR